MRLMPVEGFVSAIADLEAQDPDAAHELLRLSLFDFMSDEIAKAMPALDRDLAQVISDDNERGRRALVKAFISKRMAGEPVTDILQAAAQLTLMDSEIAKADEPWNPNQHPRDKRGLFRRVADATSAFTGGAHQPGTDTSPYTARANTVAGRDRYAHIAAAGTGLRQMNHPAATAAGTAAQVYGGISEDTRAALHNHIRRTAYRYRGTEKPADRQLVNDVRFANGLNRGFERGGSHAESAKTILAAEEPSNVKGVNVRQHLSGIREAKPIGSNTAALVRYNRAQKDKSPDQKAMKLRGDLAVEYLIKKLPSAKQTQLSIAAGRTPPSVGLLIDADGDVVSESQGFNGDHFLPFDLKNLKRLNGGQYVRTRAQGGPTTEDIYTGLMTGARQMQVVSNSGVYTVEFDPNLRGGRRYNDKAMQMVERYARLLQVVKDSGTYSTDKDGKPVFNRVLRNDISPEKRSELRQKALDRSDGSAEDAKRIYTQMLEKERVAATFTSEDDDGAIDEEARRRAIEELGQGATQGQIGRLARDLGRELRTEDMDTRPGGYQLNGEGYESALRALHEEFPFFIRDVHREPLEDFVKTRGLDTRDKSGASVRSSRGVDQGYLTRGSTTLRGALDHTKVKLQSTKAEAGTTTGGMGGTAGTSAPSTGAAGTLGNVPLKPFTDKHPLALDLKSDDDALNTSGTLINKIADLAQAAFGPPVDDKLLRNEGTMSDHAGANGGDFTWWLRNKYGSGGKALLAIQDAPPEVQDRALKTLRDLQTAKAVGSGTDEAAAQVNALAKELTPFLDRMVPFRRETDPLTLPDERPLAVPDVMRLGAVKANYASARKHIDDRILLNALSKSPDELKSALKKDISTYTKAQKLSPGEDLFAGDKEEIVGARDAKQKSDLYKRIVAYQTAWAFQHAEKIAQTVDDTPEEEAPKALPPAVGAQQQVGFAAPGQAGTAPSAQVKRVQKQDFRPLPASHPLSGHLSELLSRL